MGETEETQNDGKKDATPENDSSSDETSDSDDSSDDKWQKEFEERKRITEEKWKTSEAGEKFAEPHSVKWNKANFLNSQNHIELLQRTDGKPL
jgi:hypothetical protein